MTGPAELLDQLDQAHAAATPGPWRRNSQPGVIFGDGRDKPMPIAAGYTRPDAALIVAAVNHLPQLTAAIRAVLDFADELDGLVGDETVDEVSRVAHGWTRNRLRAVVSSALAGDPTNQEGKP